MGLIEKMYQLEVKRYLVAYRFPPSDGWEVVVDIDAMERARGGSHPPDKKMRAEAAEKWLVENGVQIGAHPVYGRADVVANKRGEPLYVVEVEGDSSRQKEQALYSALGQTVLLMDKAGETRYALAVPNSPGWEIQLKKIPNRIKKMFSLELLLVDEAGVRTLDDIP